MVYSIPIIERFISDRIMDAKRLKAAKSICSYLGLDSVNTNPLAVRNNFYNSVQELLESPDYRRILLYLPFEILRSATPKFKVAYMTAWYYMLGIYDVRENFFEGDVFEVGARPEGKVERVVKCAHLTPWLIKLGFIDVDELINIIENCHADEILLRSFRDTLGYIRDRRILPSIDICRIDESIGDLPAGKKLRPTHVTNARRAWLARKGWDKTGRLLTPGARLEGPFSSNLMAIKDGIEKAVSGLAEDEIILIGGSRLKGYGIVGSDLDIWNLDDLKSDPELCPGSPHAAHIYFNTIWASKTDESLLREEMGKIIAKYQNSPTKPQSIERLESDLLQYRLLHKGFQRLTGQVFFDTSGYPEMDGDCPFYDDKYRKIATLLYAKYVYVP